MDRGDADAGVFLFVKRYVDRWDEIKQTAHALTSTERRTRPYTHAEAVADALERKVADERDGHYEALKPWVAITGQEYPAGGTPSERLAWYRASSSMPSSSRSTTSRASGSSCS